MHVRNEHEQEDEAHDVVRLPDTLIAEIIAMVRERLQDDLPQLQSDPWAMNLLERGLHFDR
jgi:hypothetical protein